MEYVPLINFCSLQTIVTCYPDTIHPYRQWANVKGQLSWIKHSLETGSEFNFSKNLGAPVELEILKSPPEEGVPDTQLNKEVVLTAFWR